MNFKGDQLITYLFLMIFIYFGINAFLTYSFFWFGLYMPAYEAEVWSTIFNLSGWLENPLLLFKTWNGHITTVSNTFVIIDYLLFHGSNLLSLIRQYIFTFIDCLIIYKVLRQIKFPSSTIWIVVIFSFVLISSPLHWYSMNSIHEAWPDIYFFLLLSLYFFTKTNTNSFKAKIINIFLSLFFAFITSITFGISLIIFPILTILTFVSKRYKLSAIYFIGTLIVLWYGLYYAGYEDMGVPLMCVDSMNQRHWCGPIQTLYPAFSSPSFWRLLLFSFAVPSADGGMAIPDIGGITSFIHFWVWSFSRALMVIGLLCIVLYNMLVHPIFIHKIQNGFSWFKAFAHTRFLPKPWHIFFMSIIIFSLINTLAVGLARYNYPTNNHGYILATRFAYNAVFLLIPLFVFILHFISNIKKRIVQNIIRYGFLTLTVFYIQIIYIPISTNYIGLVYWNRWRLLLINDTFALNAYVYKYSIHLGGSNYKAAPMQRQWNNAAFSLWQKNIVGLNVYSLLNLNIDSPYELFPNTKSLRTNHVWNLTSPCTGIIHSVPHTLTTSDTSLPFNNHKPFRVVELKGNFIYPNNISSILISNQAGKIVGLGNVDYPYYQYLTILDVGRLFGASPLLPIGKYLSNHRWVVHAVVKLPAEDHANYSVWVLQNNRTSLCHIQNISLG